MDRRILFVAMQMSVHVARWIKSIEQRGWDLHLFPVNHLPESPEIRGITIHRPLLRIRPRHWCRALWRNHRVFRRGLGHLEKSLNPSGNVVKAILGIPVIARWEAYMGRAFQVSFGESGAVAPLLYGPHVLARLIRRLRPDLIHSMEFQHAGYRVLRAKELLGGNFPAWLATNWGSDIFYYQRFDGHRQQIRRLLETIDYYSCECERDVRLAKELGLKGKVMPVFPNAGGIDLAQAEDLRRRMKTSQRRLVLVKGYQHFAGRAMTALDALEACADSLQDFEVVLFSASPEVAQRAQELARKGILNTWVTDYLPHAQMLRLMSRARIYLGVSISDAISTSLLEAISMGAFPIQTNTSCCDEWVTHGKSAFIVDPDDLDGIAESIRTAVTSDLLVDRAAEINWKTVQERLDHRIVGHQVHEFYEEVFRDLEQHRSE